MKTNKQKDRKEILMKKIALVIRHWFSRDIDFDIAHKTIGVAIDTYTRDLLTQEREETVKKILDLRISFMQGEKDRWYYGYNEAIKRMLQQLKK